jgi:hypothetical protein
LSHACDAFLAAGGVPWGFAASTAVVVRLAIMASAHTHRQVRREIELDIGMLLLEDA